METPAGTGLSPPTVHGDQSGLLRDILASHRTLLAYIRTALSFAGLGFAVAKFGLSPRLEQASAASWSARCSPRTSSPAPRSEPHVLPPNGSVLLPYPAMCLLAGRVAERVI